MTFESWQIAHFRILGNSKYAPYGTSVLDGARRTWRQLILVEDAMMTYRVVRSPERRVFYVDVVGIPEEAVDQQMEKIKNEMKRNEIINQDTDQVDLRYNPFAAEDDFIIPVRGSKSGTRIETLSGGQNTSDIEDVQYMRNKLVASLKIPQSYLLPTDEGGNDEKGALVQKDIRFARTIQRIQKSIITELEKIGRIHLYTLGFRGKDLINFKLSLANPSRISELQDLEYMRTKIDAASNASETLFSRHWAYTNIFKMSSEEIIREERQRIRDAKIDAQLEAAATDGTMEGDGSELGAMDEIPEDELEAELEGGPEPDMDSEGGSEEEDILLTAPGRRSKQFTTTEKSKGKLYRPARFRGGDKRNMGARNRSYKGKAGGVTFDFGMDNISNGIFEEIESLKKMKEKLEE